MGRHGFLGSGRQKLCKFRSPYSGEIRDGVSCPCQPILLNVTYGICTKLVELSIFQKTTYRLGIRS